LAKKGKENIVSKWQDKDSFFLDTKDGEGKSVGQLRISVTVYPGEMSKKNPVGAGRSEPN
jgi:hypothetical protein